MTSNPTRVDRIIERFKNNSVVAVVIVASIAIIGLGSLTDAFGKFLNLLPRPANSPQKPPAAADANVSPPPVLSPALSPAPRETSVEAPEVPKPVIDQPMPTDLIEIPDLAKAIGFRRAVFTSDLLVNGGTIDSKFEREFLVRVLPSEHFYSSARILINQDVMPDFFVTAKIAGDANVKTLELQGLDVYFLLDNGGSMYGFYNTEENQTVWKLFRSRRIKMRTPLASTRTAGKQWRS
jgi:hypothetical protein